MSRYTKAWAALAAGVAVFLASGLITGSTAVWISTGVAAVTATIGVAAAPKNAEGPSDRGASDVALICTVVLICVVLLIIFGVRR